jgi:hypothetical protein
MFRGMQEQGGGFLVLLWAGLLGGFTFAFATDFAIMNSQWCIDTDDHCLREWIGALSGWAAVLAAAVTVYILARQLAEARRQTEFTIGDSRPTMAVTDPPGDLRPDDAFQNQIIFTNWNRNPVIIHGVVVDDEDGHEIMLIQIAGPQQHAKNVQQGQLNQERLFVEGWHDRTAAPPSVRINVAVGRKDEDPANKIDDFVRREFVRFAVDVTILGEHPQRTLIVAATSHALVF